MTRNNSKDKNSNFVQRFEEIADLENNIDTCRRKIIDNEIFPVNIKHFLLSFSLLISHAFYQS